MENIVDGVLEKYKKIVNGYVEGREEVMGSLEKGVSQHFNSLFTIEN